MAAARKHEFRRVMHEHHQRLNRLIDRRGAEELKRLYDRAHGEQLKQLRAHMRRLGGDSFSAYQARVVLAQLKAGQAALSARLAGEIIDLANEAQRESLRGLAIAIERLEPSFKGAEVRIRLEEAARFAGILDERRTSIVRAKREEAEEAADSMRAGRRSIPERVKGTLERYSVETIGKLEDELAVSALNAETPLQAMSRVEEFVDGDWYRAERIVRTETAWASNATARDGMAAASEELPDLMMQWSEYCEADGEPLDDRVGVDSIAMHGQLAPPDGMFTCPPTAPYPDEHGETRVSKGLAGEQWEHPPNRPNDRSALAPWRRDWELPGWKWQGNRRIWLVRQ